MRLKGWIHSVVLLSSWVIIMEVPCVEALPFKNSSVLPTYPLDLVHTRAKRAAKRRNPLGSLEDKAMSYLKKKGEKHPRFGKLLKAGTALSGAFPDAKEKILDEITSSDIYKTATTTIQIAKNVMTPLLEVAGLLPPPAGAVCTCISKVLGVLSDTFPEQDQDKALAAVAEKELSEAKKNDILLAEIHTTVVDIKKDVATLLEKTTQMSTDIAEVNEGMRFGALVSANEYTIRDYTKMRTGVAYEAVKEMCINKAPKQDIKNVVTYIDNNRNKIMKELEDNYYSYAANTAHKRLTHALSLVTYSFHFCVGLMEKDLTKALENDEYGFFESKRKEAADLLWNIEKTRYEKMFSDDKGAVKLKDVKLKGEGEDRYTTAFNFLRIVDQFDTHYPSHKPLFLSKAVAPTCPTTNNYSIGLGNEALLLYFGQFGTRTLEATSPEKLAQFIVESDLEPSRNLCNSSNRENYGFTRCPRCFYTGHTGRTKDSGDKTRFYLNDELIYTRSRVKGGYTDYYMMNIDIVDDESLGDLPSMDANSTKAFLANIEENAFKNTQGLVVESYATGIKWISVILGVFVFSFM